MKNIFVKLNTKRRLLGVALAIALIAIIVVIALLQLNSTVPKEDIKEEIIPNSFPQAQDVVVISTDSPSEEIPTLEYTTDAEDPRSIIIPSIGVNGFVQKVGIDQNNEIAVPNNIHFAGWYTNSVKPGEKGLSIIDGHVDGPTSQGIFGNLNSLEKDQIFEIEYGDGSKISFKVVDKIQVKVEDAYNVLFSKKSEITSQLNLITCGGNFNLDTGRYDDRIIVVTERI